MPYIAQEERDRAQFAPRTPGELNYAFTMALIAVWRNDCNPMALNIASQSVRELINYYWSEKSFSGYTALNDIMGALGGALIEFRRRVPMQGFGRQAIQKQMIVRAFTKVLEEFYNTIAVPYEEKKIAENGDVY